MGLVRRYSLMACRMGHGQSACAHSVPCGTNAAHMKTVSLAWCIGHLRVDVRACRMCAQFSHVPRRVCGALGLALPLVRADS